MAGISWERNRQREAMELIKERNRWGDCIVIDEHGEWHVRQKGARELEIDRRAAAAGV